MISCYTNPNRNYLKIKFYIIHSSCPQTSYIKSLLYIKVISAAVGRVVEFIAIQSDWWGSRMTRASLRRVYYSWETISDSLQSSRWLQQSFIIDGGSGLCSNWTIRGFLQELELKLPTDGVGFSRRLLISSSMFTLFSFLSSASPAEWLAIFQTRLFSTR